MWVQFGSLSNFHDDSSRCRELKCPFNFVSAQQLRRCVHFKIENLQEPDTFRLKVLFMFRELREEIFNLLLTGKALGHMDQSRLCNHRLWNCSNSSFVHYWIFVFSLTIIQNHLIIFSKMFVAEMPSNNSRCYIQFRYIPISFHLSDSTERIFVAPLILAVFKKFLYINLSDHDLLPSISPSLRVF